MRCVRDKQPLPVDAILAQIAPSFQQSPNLVIEAPAGAGKTTRVPQTLLDQLQGEVLVLEPRRIAARLAARRVAWERGEQVGETVGYQVRFERVAGVRTRLLFVTDGVLIRRLLSDPSLAGVDAVVLDEFHERHMECDLALALLRRLQRTRPTLKIVVMSATLDAAPVAEYLDNCPVLRSGGRLYGLSIQHLPYSPAPLHTQVRGALDLLLAEREAGNILVFLPGAAEIRRAMRECAPAAHRAGILMLPLHGDLSPAEQDRVVSPATQQKLILSTNVAESSVTIDGVTAVIDSGLARRSSWSPWTGLPMLQVSRVSKASAQQRAGRAGRTAAGRVLRLYTEMDYQQRAEQETPELLRSDLSQLCLALRVMGIERSDELDWLDAPPTASVQKAEQLLDQLGARGEMLHKLARYPLHPRLARMLVEAMARGVGESGCVAAALLGASGRSNKTDLLAAIESPLDNVAQLQLRQLRQLARPAKQSEHHDDALLQSVLAGFPDRVARRKPGGHLLLSNGVSAEIAGAPPTYEFMVALDAEDRTENPLPLIRLTARIEPEWLIDLFPEQVREKNLVVWNRQAERVDAVSRMVYDELVLQESNNAAPESEAAATMLAEKALETGIERFVDAEALQLWTSRVEFAGLAQPDLSAVLKELCGGLRSFAELKNAGKDFLFLLEQKVDARRLRETAPVSVRLQNGRSTKVHYEPGKPPWIASRLQDFFGMSDTPRLGPDRVPVVAHLLAPNHRAVQTTSDLAGFWERLYPQVRRELMRRYPKHQWPEHP
jgi:ATP-dependent helicase HrpB